MARLLVVLFGMAVLTTAAVSGQTKRESIQGVWQTAEVTVTGPGARTITIPEPRPNLLIVSASHYSRVEVQAEGPRPIPADVTKATADELRAVWGPFVGEAGTYELSSANRITMRPIAAKNPAAMATGAFITYSYKLDRNTISLTAQKDQNGPILNPITVKAVRVE